MKERAYCWRSFQASPLVAAKISLPFDLKPALPRRASCGRRIGGPGRGTLARSVVHYECRSWALERLPLALPGGLPNWWAVWKKGAVCAGEIFQGQMLRHRNIWVGSATGEGFWCVDESISGPHHLMWFRGSNVASSPHLLMPICRLEMRR